MRKFILWFNQIGIKDIPIVGGKNASLGEMYRNLSRKGINVPNGFAVTAQAYKYLLRESRALPALKKVLRGLDVTDINALAQAGKQAREIILNCQIPKELEKEIIKAYAKLCKEYRTENLDVAVRSSATAEDLPEASFAGQQETYLNIRGTRDLLLACRKCFASLFTDRAIVYRTEHKFNHFKVYLSIGIQKMVRSDLACSGVMFTLDTETGFKDVVMVTGSYGLGENIVQGAVNPDEFIIFKPTLDKYKPIIDKSMGEKATKIIYSQNGIKKVKTPKAHRTKFCLTDEEALKLGKWGVVIEDYYSQKKHKWCPMDIEWAKDGRTNELFIVQARPESVQSRKDRTVIETYQLLQKGKVLAIGKSVGNKIAKGTAHIIKSVKDISKFRAGEILITEITDPDWVPIMKIASAIVTNRGGRTSHAAIVSRELGIPCVVGTNNATEKIKNNQKITVSCAEGEQGVVYDGFLKFKTNKINLRKIPKTKTKIMINVGNPDSAFEQSFLPNDGVGLAREEFIVTEFIKIHPLALIHFDKIKDKSAKKKIEKLTFAYKDKKQFYIDELSMGTALIAAAFYPKEVILRFSDFKTNEYANLIGGKEFEPKEENPMLGWRGASRYYSENYREAFALECKAIKKVRETFGLKNLKIMIPMCRTIEEGKKVLEEMQKNRLVQGKDLEVYVMCEIPSNVILAEEFCKIFDGFSIGSNDLTQMTLGVDRDSSLVAGIYDERNPAVLWMLERVIKIAKKHKRKIGICGDAPSTYPEIAKFLVNCGIDSISLSPDAVVSTRVFISKHEK